MFNPGDRGYLRRPVDLPDTSRAFTDADADRSRSPSTGAWQQSDLLPLFIDSVEDYAIYALDADGNVATWNRGAHAVKGYTAEEIVGRPVATFYPPDDVASGKPERDLAIAAAAGHLQEEGWRVRKDGAFFWASVLVTALRGADGRLVGFGKVTRDLTERRRGDELLRDSEERFRLLVNSVADYAIFLLDTEGIVSSWNLGAERLKGYRADEVIGRHFSIFYTDEDMRERVPDRLLRTALEDGHVESEGWRIRKDGSRFWASVVITALRAPDGSRRGFAKVTKDLTDRKRNEDALRGVLERERDAAERLRELDRMRTAVFELVAHDLRAPLGVIQNLTYLLQTGWDELPDDTKRDHLNRIASRTTTMGELVDDLFQVVRIDAGQVDIERSEFDVNEVIERAVGDALPQGIADRTRIRIAGGVRALGDARRTWEVLLNLLTNAAKFSPPGSAIDIDVTRDAEEVAVAVTDRGPGIALEEQHLLFQRFSRLSTGRDTPGSGIGLFIAKSLVEAQGGEISVRSEAGQGATFRFTIPAAP